MKFESIFLYVFPGTITASKTFRVMTNNSGNQPSRSLLCDIIMHKNKDIQLLFLKFWGKNRAVEVATPGLVTHRKYPYIRASLAAIISWDCHGYNIIEISVLTKQGACNQSMLF